VRLRQDIQHVNRWAGVIAVTLLVSGCGSEQSGPQRGSVVAGAPPAAQGPEGSPASVGAGASLIERGRGIYAEQKCQACHSIAGTGNRRYPLDGVGSKLSPDDIRRWIVAPREMNPSVSKRAFDRIPAADLDALVAYVSSLRKG
jgi:mono/diheme cytochrome c family protein